MLEEIYKFQISLFMLGYHILIRCKYEKFLEGIKYYYSSVVEDAWCTPDIIIDCNWDNVEKSFFSARSFLSKGPLKGVRVHTNTVTSDKDWDKFEPPLPPFTIPPIRNKFITLHAAAVISPATCLLILGKGGSGKTTISSKLVNSHGFSILSDDTSFIRNGTRLIEYFPRPIKLIYSENDTLKSKYISISDYHKKIAKKAALVTHAIFINKNYSNKMERIVPLSYDEAFRYFLDYYSDIGCTHNTGIKTLINLTKTIKSFEYSYSSYESLVNFVPNIEKSLK